MGDVKPVAGVYSVSCMDPRERIVEAGHAKFVHLSDSLDRQGCLYGEVALQLHEERVANGLKGLQQSITFFRNGRGGGGWSLDSRDDLEIIADNKLQLIAAYSGRHSLCAAVGVRKHLHDTDVAVMMVEDFHAVGLPMPPIFRAHLEVVTKHEEFDPQPMNIRALVAHAVAGQISQKFPGDRYDPDRAAHLLGIDCLDRAELADLRNSVQIGSKGLLRPGVDLRDPVHAH